MNCPTNIVNIYMKERKQRCSEGNFLSLTPRKGRALERSSEFSPLEDKEAQKVLEAWYAFHEKAGHRAYADFYSKIFYCQNFNDFSDDPDTFLELIADREFLFFEYSESYTPPDYPPLSHLVKSFDAEEHNYPEEKRNMVLEQAFVPTQAHRQGYSQWQKNLRSLQEARSQRIRQLEELKEIPSPFSIEIHVCAETDITDFEICLSCLLATYLQYFCDAGNILYNEKVKEPSVFFNVIHTIMEHLSSCPS